MYSEVRVLVQLECFCEELVFHVRVLVQLEGFFEELVFHLVVVQPRQVVGLVVFRPPFAGLGGTNHIGFVSPKLVWEHVQPLWYFQLVLA